MFIDVIFISKVDKIDKNKLVNDFKEKADFKDNQLICDKLVFNYEFQKSINNSIIRLKVSTKKGTKTYNEAKDLSYLKDQIRKGKHRENYNIIIDYDGSSEYYCNKLSPFISQFERKLRQCIYLITLAAYDNEWVKKTISEDIMKEVKEKDHNKNSHVEMALECFTFKNYADYLFVPREQYNPVNVIEEAKIEINNNESEKKDVLSILNKYEVISLWKKLFDTYYEIEFSEEDIMKIGDIRNKVLHHKEVSDSDFLDYKKLLMKSNKKIDCAIRRIEDEKYKTTVNVADVLYSFNEAIKSMVISNVSIQRSVKPVMEDLKVIIGSMSKLIQCQEPFINVSLQHKLAGLNSPAYKAFLSSFSKLQDSVRLGFSDAMSNYYKSIGSLNVLTKSLAENSMSSAIKSIQSTIDYPENIKIILKAMENNQNFRNNIDKFKENISEEENN